jgi:hypothetical protein
LLKIYIYNFIKIPKYFSNILSQMYWWTGKFQIQILYGVRDTKKKKLLVSKKKVQVQILKHVWAARIEGIAEMVLRTSTLLEAGSSTPRFMAAYHLWGDLAAACMLVGPPRRLCHIAHAWGPLAYRWPPPPHARLWNPATLPSTIAACVLLDFRSCTNLAADSARVRSSSTSETHC